MSENSNIKVTISPDEYSAYLTVVPEPGLTLSMTDLGPILKDEGVVYGIKRDALTIIVARCQKGIPVENILVAEGILPFEGVEPKVDFKFEFSSKPKVDQDGKMDYRETSQILSVEKGQLLAVKQKMKPPVDGKTVTGKVIKFPPFQDSHFRVGDNIEIIDDGDQTLLKAAESGVINFVQNKLSVAPALRIEQDVDFNVGNVHFKGDVTIGRDVLPDFVIEAKGKISIWGSAIACKLQATDSVEVRAGIVGKNKGEVIAGTDITATFIENATIRATNDINVKNGIVGSDVYCNGILKMDIPKSRLVGCTIRAAKSIFIYNAGSRFDTSTRLITGINPDKAQEYQKIKSFLDMRINEAKEIEKKYGRNVLEQQATPRVMSPNFRTDLARWQCLKGEIQKVLKRLKQTEEQMYDYDAVIRVKDTLFPRVFISIGKHKTTTIQEYHKVTVRYSPEEDRLVIA